MKIRWSIIALLLASTHLWAQEVFTKNGNVYFKDNQDKVVQVTTSGQDYAPSLSQNGKLIAFVRDTLNLFVSTGSGDVSATELWLLNLETQKADLLVRGKEDAQIEKTLAGFESPRFSPDNRSIYFISAAWATSGSIQKIELDTKKIQFLTDGVTLEVISNKGEYNGFLLVDKALIKLDKDGDSLGRDLYLWLISPNGNPLKEIGQGESKEALEFRKNAQNR
ncbi:hypothetical protein JCM14076_12340 [Methylosoma difficile]